MKLKTRQSDTLCTAHTHRVGQSSLVRIRCGLFSVHKTWKKKKKTPANTRFFGPIPLDYRAATCFVLSGGDLLLYHNTLRVPAVKNVVALIIVGRLFFFFLRFARRRRGSLRPVRFFFHFSFLHYFFFATRGRKRRVNPRRRHACIAITADDICCMGATRRRVRVERKNKQTYGHGARAVEKSLTRDATAVRAIVLELFARRPRGRGRNRRDDVRRIADERNKRKKKKNSTPKVSAADSLSQHEAWKVRPLLRITCELRKKNAFCTTWRTVTRRDDNYLFFQSKIRTTSLKYQLLLSLCYRKIIIGTYIFYNSDHRVKWKQNSSV